MQRNVSTGSQQTVSYLGMRGYVVKTEKIPKTQTTNKVSCSVSCDSSVLNRRFSPTPHGATTQEKENTELNWLKTYSWLITAKHNWRMNPAGGGKFQELETCASTSLLRVWRSKTKGLWPFWRRKPVFWESSIPIWFECGTAKRGGRGETFIANDCLRESTSLLQTCQVHFHDSRNTSQEINGRLRDSSLQGHYTRVLFFVYHSPGVYLSEKIIQLRRLRTNKPKWSSYNKTQLKT